MSHRAMSAITIKTILSRKKVLTHISDRVEKDTSVLISAIIGMICGTTYTITTVRARTRKNIITNGYVSAQITLRLRSSCMRSSDAIA